MFLSIFLFSRMTLIHRDLTSAFKLLRDRSSVHQAGFYDVDRDENEQLINKAQFKIES